MKVLLSLLAPIFVVAAALLAGPASALPADQSPPAVQQDLQQVKGYDLYKRKQAHHDWNFVGHYKTLGAAWSAASGLGRNGYMTKIETCYE